MQAMFVERLVLSKIVRKPIAPAVRKIIKPKKPEKRKERKVRKMIIKRLSFFVLIENKGI